MSEKNIFSEIVIGAGASGLFYAATGPSAADGPVPGGQKLILEKTGRPGQKLLMSGSGACNITHGGSIKDFIGKYSGKGSKIRTCLYRHNNLELMAFMEDGGVKLMEREDGKVFPVSMKASDVLDLLLHKAAENGYDLRLRSDVTGISVDKASGKVQLTLAGGDTLLTNKLIIATGGASYPATGSDGSFAHILRRDLDIEVTELKPALAPVFVQNYPFTDISGVSVDEAEVTIGKHTVYGPVLFTHKGFSGPAVLHISQYAKPGTDMIVNFLPGNNAEDILRQLKQEQPANSKGTANYLAQRFNMPKALIDKGLEGTGLKDHSRKFSTLQQKELAGIAHFLTCSSFSVSGTGGWNEAMVTAGGVSLSEMDLKKMSLTSHPQIRVIGEALDINGDTGGYNLQFAYSSACMAHEE